MSAIENAKTAVQDFEENLKKKKKKTTTRKHDINKRLR